MVHQRDVGRVVQARAFGQQASFGQQLLGVLVAVFGQEHLVALLVEREVAGLDDPFASARVGFADLLFQRRHHGVDAHVQLGMVLGLAADDQRRARLVDQDRIDLVDDGIRQPARHAVGDLVDHVVAQVVEAELVVGAVGHVGGIGRLLLVALHAGHVDADREPEKGVDTAHPLGIAARQVVVDGDQVHALAGQRIQVHRQRGHQRLALAGAHLGDLAFVQRDAAHQLHVEVAHLEHALARLAHHGKSLGQQLVERFALRQPLTKLRRLGLQRGIVERLELRLQLVDLLRSAPVALQQAVVATTENLGQDLWQHAASHRAKGSSAGCCDARMYRLGVPKGGPARAGEFSTRTPAARPCRS